MLLFSVLANENRWGEYFDVPMKMLSNETKVHQEGQLKCIGTF